jgi:hypothetical protein
MKKISILIFLAAFLVSCGSDCDCRKHKMNAKYKINNSTGETMFDGYEHNDSIHASMDSIKRMKMKKMRKKWRKAKKDSIKN